MQFSDFLAEDAKYHIEIALNNVFGPFLLEALVSKPAPSFLCALSSQITQIVKKPSCVSIRQVLQTKRDNVTKESNEFKGEYGRYMATMSKKVTEGKAEHTRLTEYVSILTGYFKDGAY